MANKNENNELSKDAILINDESLTEDKREALLIELFGNNGIKLTFED